MKVYDYRSKLINPEKYNSTRSLTLRSSYEIEFIKKLDLNPNVLSYSCESVRVSYYFPYKLANSRLAIIPHKGRSNGFHSYFIDNSVEFITDKVNEHGEPIKEIAWIEIKAENLLQPLIHKGNQRSYTWLKYQKAMNHAKWKMAIKKCKELTEKMGIQHNFYVFTMKEIKEFPIS